MKKLLFNILNLSALFSAADSCTSVKEDYNCVTTAATVDKFCTWSAEKKECYDAGAIAGGKTGDEKKAGATKEGNTTTNDSCSEIKEASSCTGTCTWYAGYGCYTTKDEAGKDGSATKDAAKTDTCSKLSSTECQASSDCEFFAAQSLCYAKSEKSGTSKDAASTSKDGAKDSSGDCYGTYKTKEACNGDASCTTKNFIQTK